MTAIEIPGKEHHFTASGIRCRADMLGAAVYELPLYFEVRIYQIRVLAYNEQHARDSWLNADDNDKLHAVIAAGYAVRG